MPKASAKTLPADGGAVAQAMPATYEDAMRELELLVSQLESGALPLEEMLSGYQRAAQLLQLCRDRLQSVEDQIKVLDGGVLKPWSAQ